MKQITLHFHAILSEDFKFDPAKNKLILRMSDNWDDVSNVCTVKK